MSSGKKTRLLVVSVIVLVAWALLAIGFSLQPDRGDRLAILLVGIVVLILAVLVSRGNSLPRSRNSDIGGAGLGGSDVGFGESDSHHTAAMVEAATEDLMAAMVVMVVIKLCPFSAIHEIGKTCP